MSRHLLLTFSDQRSARQAFSLMELLVVISIIAILVAILMPVLGVVRQGGYAVGCQSHLRQMYIGIQGYRNDWNVYPPGRGPYNRPWPHAMAATYSESGHNGSDGNAARDLLKCPADRRIVDGMGGFFDSVTYMQVTWMNNSEEKYGEWTRLWSSYCFNSRVFYGSFEPNDRPRRASVSSNMALFWDSHRFSTSGWVSPGQLGDIPGVNRHQRGVNMLFGDGRVAHLSMSPLEKGQFWTIVPWAIDYMWNSVRCINASFSPGPFDSDNAPWQDI